MQFYKIEFYEDSSTRQPLTFVRTEQREANRLFSTLRRTAVKRGEVDAHIFMRVIGVKKGLPKKELTRRMLEGTGFIDSVSTVREWPSLDLEAL